MRSCRQARSRYLLGLEYAFLVLGLIAVDCYIWVNTSSTLYQAYQDWAFDQTLRGLQPSVQGFVKDEFSWFSGGSRTASPTVAETPSTGEIAPPTAAQALHADRSLEIPRLHMKAMVREGADEGTLRKAVGHIPGTALPGGDRECRARGPSRHVLSRPPRHPKERLYRPKDR